MSNEIPMIPVQAEELTPAEYLREFGDNPGQFASVRIRPPQLGSHGFGGIVVEYRSPRFRPRFGRLNGLP
jgi:hypothetical protein